MLTYAMIFAMIFSALGGAVAMLVAVLAVIAYGERRVLALIDSASEVIGKLSEGTSEASEALKATTANLTETARVKAELMADLRKVSSLLAEVHLPADIQELPPAKKH